MTAQGAGGDFTSSARTRWKCVTMSSASPRASATGPARTRDRPTPAPSWPRPRSAPAPGRRRPAPGRPRPRAARGRRRQLDRRQLLQRLLGGIGVVVAQLDLGLEEERVEVILLLFGDIEGALDELARLSPSPSSARARRRARAGRDTPRRAPWPLEGLQGAIDVTLGVGHRAAQRVGLGRLRLGRDGASASRRASSTCPSSSCFQPASISCSIFGSPILLRRESVCYGRRYNAHDRRIAQYVASRCDRHRVVLMLAGCPKRFDPRADTVRRSPDGEADHDYHEAKARLDIGDAKEAQGRFAEFLRKHPNDPLAPSARIGEARAELMLNQPGKAKGVLEPMAAGGAEDPTAARARYLLGLTLHKTGEWARSRELLRPFVAGDRRATTWSSCTPCSADDSAHLDDVRGRAARVRHLLRGRAADREALLARSGLGAACPAAVGRGGAPVERAAARFAGRRLSRQARGRRSARRRRRRSWRRRSSTSRAAPASAPASRSRKAPPPGRLRAAARHRADLAADAAASGRSASGHYAARCWPPTS